MVNLDFASMPISLSLTLLLGKWSDGSFFLVWQLNLTKILLIIIDVTLQSLKQALCVFWSHDNPTLDLWLWHSWECASEVKDKVGTGVSDERKV